MSFRPTSSNPRTSTPSSPFPPLPPSPNRASDPMRWLTLRGGSNRSRLAGNPRRPSPHKATHPNPSNECEKRIPKEVSETDHMCGGGMGPAASPGDLCVLRPLYERLQAQYHREADAVPPAPAPTERDGLGVRDGGNAGSGFARHF